MVKDLGCKPIFIKDDKSAKELSEENLHLIFVDAFVNQIKELFLIENHKYIGEPKEEVYKTEDFKNYCTKNNDYIYVYYPWNNTLVKIVKKEKYLILKTNRNRNLITEEEQNKLRDFKIGIFGMSVGSNIAFVLTQAGISNSITIADFDTLDTTNLNRIFAGVHQIGLNKTTVASRRIYEDNPFAEVKIMDKGINSENLEFLLKEKQLDCIIEEIDDLPMKIKTRILAKKYKIPVIMITDNGDGIVLHIERYDLGYDKIFDKDLPYWEELIKKPITREIAGQIIMNDIVGGLDKVDPNMLNSVKDVLQKKLVSWPQLGSAAVYAGVIGTYAIKQIFENKTLYIHKNFDLSI